VNIRKEDVTYMSNSSMFIQSVEWNKIYRLGFGPCCVIPTVQP
jgi:hypothetical protein